MGEKTGNVQIFMVLPKILSVRKVYQEFKASNYMLPPATGEMVKQFYISHEVERIMPGTKDYVSVNSEGKKVHLQKQLILCILF
jgi:hypothetical protein